MAHTSEAVVHAKPSIKTTGHISRISSEQAQKEHHKLGAMLTIAISMIGAALISYFVLIHKSLRLDESQSIWQSSHSFSGMLHAVALDVHVPLYHSMLHFWIFFFGSGVVTVRLLSLIFFLLTIPVVYLLSRELVSHRWAVITTLLFSFSPFMNWYANEARMYTLLVLMATLSQYFFIRILKSGKGWFLYGLTTVIGAYSHYFFLFNIASQALFFLFYRKKFAKGSFIRFATIAVLIVIALSPWLLYFHSLGSGSDSRPHLPKPSTVDFFNVYSQFIFGFQNDRINTILLSSWPLVMLAALVAVKRNHKLVPEVSFIATMATLPVFLAYGVSLVITPFFLSRYMISSVAPLLLLLVWLVSQYGKYAARIAVAGLFVMTILVSTQQANSFSTPVKEDYRAVSNTITAEQKPQDLIVLSAPFTIYPFEYYYNGTARISTLPVWDRVSPGAIPTFSKATLPADVAALNKNHRYIYLVLSQDQGYEETINQYYLSHFKQISHTSFSHDLTLYVYQVGFYTVPAI